MRTLIIASIALGILIGSVTISWAISAGEELGSRNATHIEQIFGN